MGPLCGRDVAGAMRIGIDARMMGRDVRGIGRYVERLLAHLALQDSENRYTVFTRPSAVDLVPAGMETVVTGIHWYGLAEQWSLPDIFEGRGLDFVHVPHWNAPVRMRVPLIMTIHDMILWERPALGATTLSPIRYAMKYLGYRLTVSANARRARRILAVSESARSAIFRTLGTPPEKVAVTPLGIDPLIRGDLPPGVRPPFVLSVGSGYPHKNLTTFFHTADQLMNEDQELQAVICGTDPAFRDRLVREAKGIFMGNFPRVVFTGVVPDPELAALYANANALLFTSFDEGFGLPLLEAAAVGLPVVASDINTSRETLHDAAILVPPTDIHAYLHAYRRLMAEPTIKDRNIVAAKARVADFSWERTARLTLAAYREAFSTP